MSRGALQENAEAGTKNQPNRYFVPDRKNGPKIDPHEDFISAEVQAFRPTFFCQPNNRYFELSRRAHRTISHERTNEEALAMGNVEARDASQGAAGGGGDRQIRVELDVEKAKMRKLIGTKGETIKNIQSHCANVKLMTPGKDDASSDELRYKPETNMYICIHIYMYICIYIFVYTYMCTYMYVYI